MQTIGRYEIERELGQGGMATVHLARDPLMKRPVAVKVLPRQCTFDPQFRARFQREAEIIAALEHHHIVPVYDYGEHEEQPFIVMRFMPGGSLLEQIDKGPFSLPEVARVIGRLAEALDYAHAKGIVHRDLKPGNILFDGQGEPYISDFGIAKMAEASTTYTGTGIIGTPAYMSPEQARGSKELDNRSDVYSLGVILFEMLTGRLPYTADSAMGLVVAHITEPVPTIRAVKPDLPADCEVVIARAMAKDPAGRYTTAGELARVVSHLFIGRVEVTAPALPTVLTPALEPKELGRAIDVTQFVRRNTLKAHFGSVSCVVFSPDGHMLASGGEDKTVRVWDTASGQCLRMFEDPYWVNSLAVSPDGRSLVSVCADGVIRVWDLASGQVLRAMETSDQWAGVAFSPDGRLLASGSREGVVRVWVADTGELLHTLEGHTNRVCLAFSPHEHVLASGSYDTTVRLWDAARGQPLRILQDTGGLNSIAFSRDGHILASGGTEDTVRLWDSVSGHLLHKLPGHKDGVHAVTFAPDGRTLVSGGADKIVRLWDATTGRLLHILKGHRDWVNSVAFSPNGRMLASGSSDGTIRLWGVPGM